MQQLSASRKRIRSAAISPDKSDTSRQEEEESASSLFFPQGERRRDLNPPDGEFSKRLFLDAPVFSREGLFPSLAAREPLATESLMGVATGQLVYYGMYFEQNKLLRELAFEREARYNFGRVLRASGDTSITSTKHGLSRSANGFGQDDEMDDL